MADERTPTSSKAIDDRAELVQSLVERLSGQMRQTDFESLILDAAQAAYGTVGRGYLETRLKMAAAFESILMEANGFGEPEGHA